MYTGCILPVVPQNYCLVQDIDLPKVKRKQHMKQMKFVLLAAIVLGSAAFTIAQTSGKKIKVNRNVMMADELVKSGSYYNAIDIYLQEFNETANLMWLSTWRDTYFKARDYKILRHGFRGFQTRSDKLSGSPILLCSQHEV